MERSEEGDAREIAAWQIAVVLATSKLCLESLQHLVTKNLYRCRYCRFALSGWLGYFLRRSEFLFFDETAVKSGHCIYAKTWEH
jgi:hypothetical protein